jgi:hypothetical protein
MNHEPPYFSPTEDADVDARLGEVFGWTPKELIPATGYEALDGWLAEARRMAEDRTAPGKVTLERHKRGFVLIQPCTTGHSLVRLCVSQPEGFSDGRVLLELDYGHDDPELGFLMTGPSVSFHVPLDAWDYMRQFTFSGGLLRMAPAAHSVLATDRAWRNVVGLMKNTDARLF